MSKILGAFALLITVFLACDKSDNSNDDSQVLDGRYLGTFHRTGNDTADVSILFRDNHFEGSTDKVKYPAICGGSYSIQGTLINFADSCSWTADFDWSLILSGTFNFQVNNGTVRIWKTNGAVTDEYLLRRSVR